MNKTYRDWSPNQAYLFPPSPQDWLPEDDLVYFILETVATLDLTPLFAHYERELRGQPPFHPRMMVTLLLYCSATGTRSSRKIMRRCRTDVACRIIVGDDIPDFRTISDFRKTHLTQLETLFVEVLKLCALAGLVKVGTIALDGTKVKANASRHKAMSYERMQEEEKRLKEEVARLLAEAEATDATEDAAHGPDRSGEELRGLLNNNLNNWSLVFRCYCVVPFAVKRGFLQSDRREFFIGDLDTGPVSLGIQLRSNPQPGLRRRVADQIHDDRPRAERLATPVLRDVAEHAVLDLVPLARPGWEVAHRDPQAQVIRQVLQPDFPQPRPIAVTAPGIGGDQQPPGLRIDRRPHLLPPAPDTRHGELGRVMIDADADPALVPTLVIDPFGDGLAQLLVREVLGAGLFGVASATPLSPGIAEIPDQFLLLRID
jgi:transposase